MSTNTPITKYRWVSAYHWFEEQFLEVNGVEGEVRAAISSLVRNADPEYIEQYFGSQMEEEGYYNEILEDLCPDCGEVIELSEAAQCFECKQWFHTVTNCIDRDSYYKDPMCYSCQEIKESLHL